MLGANDGLVSVASIMLGVGATNVNTKTLVLSGTSALVAGRAPAWPDDYHFPSNKSSSSQSFTKLGSMQSMTV